MPKFVWLAKDRLTIPKGLNPVRNSYTPNDQAVSLRSRAFH